MIVYDKLNPDIKGIAPYQPGKPIEDLARERGLDPNTIMKLASNESALGPSPRAMAAMQANLANCHRYPDGNAYLLRKKISEKYDVALEQVIISNGSNEILELVGHCFMNRSTSTVFSRHSFVVYKLTTQLFGSRIIEVPMTADLTHDIDTMVGCIEDDTAVIFICNPNNPTGTMVNANDLDNAIRTIPEHVLIVIDEAYAEVATSAMPDTRRYLDEKENVVICRTFSKGYGLAGLRLGYGLGAKPIIAALQQTRQPFNVNLMAQAAGVAALDDDAFVAAVQKMCVQAKTFLERSCRDLKLSFVPSTANFMLIDVGNGTEVTDQLMNFGIIVRSMEGYGLPQYLRVTYGREDENERFVEALRSVIKDRSCGDLI